MAAPKTQTQAGTAVPHLWQIAAAGDLDQLEDILNRGADINASNPSGLTPLMVAAYHGRIEMVRALIEHGAEVNAADDEGLTAAMLADDAGHDEIVRMLVGRAVKRKRRSPAPEPSADPSAQSPAVNTVSDPETPTHRITVAQTSPVGRAPDDIVYSTSDSEAVSRSVPEVRTLHEPPDIWDVVHEARTEFNPGSAFFGRLTLRHSVIAAATLLIVGGAVALGFMGLRRLSSNDTARAPVPAERNNPKPSLVTAPSNKNQAARDKRATSKSAGAATATHLLFDPKKLVVGVTGIREQKVVPLREESPAISSARGDVVMFHADNRKKNQKSNLPAANNATVAAMENRDRGQPLGSRSDNDKRANSTAARKETGKVPAPESISPPRTNPAPKGKVIEWP
jgi:hypothetical protein